MWVPTADGNGLVNLDRCEALVVDQAEWHATPPTHPWLVRAYPSRTEGRGYVLARYATKEEGAAHLADLLATLGQPF